ncbi:hypothetical protein VOM14_10200 [Paraburkholderia sp. MPAMCS5]|uniref:hypothetical protein n=1 Tax=Paraburkholderia sp. MPAMCS5 TaxID=3112563 RepID=UPI002E19F81F|nr:hypothetical protein [Paraburkholderia sp. MPAMCS5]
MYPFGCSRFSYWGTAAIQMAIFFVAVLTLVWQAMRAQLGLFAALFFISNAGGFMFNVLGYPEFFMYLLAFTAIALINSRRYIPASIIAAVLILTHELAVFAMIPLLCLACLFVEREFRTKPLVILLAPAVLLFAVQLAWFQTSSDSTLAHWVAQRAACGHPLVRTDFLDVLTNSYRARLDLYFSPSQREFVLPPIAVLAFVAGRQLSQPFGQRALYAIAIMGACLSPLLLGLAAWDTNRWLLMTFTNILIVMITAARIAPAGRLKIADSMPLLAAFILVVATLNLDYFELKPRTLDDAGVQSLRLYLTDDIRHPPEK